MPTPVIPHTKLQYCNWDEFDPAFADTFRNEAVHLHISTVNWPEFPLKPDVHARLAHNGSGIYCLFDVEEPHLRVAALSDNGPVWEDSCVELFVATLDGKHYCNIEVNAAATALAARRESREKFKHFSAAEMAEIKRCSTVPHMQHDEKPANGNIKWSLLLYIPFELMGFEACPDSIRINLYKCGDKTETPHFLSWNPIGTTTPDFHRPEFFKEISLDKSYA